MFFPTNTPHGLPHNPFNAIVLPRPIGRLGYRDYVHVSESFSMIRPVW